MSDSQKQDAAEGATAYQAKGDINIYNGSTAQQMAEIIGAISQQLSHFAAEARTIAEERCEEFRKEILEKVAEPHSKAHTEAFKDPDFQHSLHNSLREFARKGGDELKSELITLLIERSSKNPRDRISLILNESIETAPKLSKQDKDVLIVLFSIKNIHIHSANMLGIYSKLRLILQDHVEDLPEGTGCFEYLQALGCISIERVADHYPLNENFFKLYGELPGIDIIENRTKDSFWTDLKNHVPEIAKIDNVWTKSFYRQSAPTAVGRAIAHAILFGEEKLESELEKFFN